MIELETIPKGWVVANFNECCENISLNGIKIKQKQYLASGKFPVIDQGRELIGGYFNDELLVVPNEPPYIVFGDHTKVKKFVTFKFIAGADGVKVLKPYDFILPNLFYYFIHAVKMPDKGYARHYQFLASEKFPIPPLNEQKRILAKLEQLLTDLDKGIEYLETAQKQLKVYRQAVLKWAFEGRLTGDGETNFQEKKLKDICDITGGVTKGRNLDNKNTVYAPYLRVANVQDGYLDLSVIKEIEVLPADIQKYKLIEGDILYTEGGDRDKLGRGTIWRNEVEGCIHQNHIFRARPKSLETNSKYVAFYSQTKGAKDYFFAKGKQTTNLASINLTVLSNLPIPSPPREEQNKIVKEIESRLSVCDKIEETIESSLQQAEALRLSIIKKAFEGKLVSQDPNDEPAEKLLEKIRAAKGNGKPEKKAPSGRKVNSKRKINHPN